ncbi:MAG TPA: SGNH/GDSL hydrolase family protein [Ideonella sp.]|uniref:SGNH/GDSL hydrolase family protein n=1 Tax=Ideonella sp. TaxID=1929293 RepID=UPI002E309C63|nr:SGNH/GDSL hydrolase family protein [Ideonella sp.]HEX5687743.1 SGNH/GDSL hydrolase family protein [Ideonella sp.]
MISTSLARRASRVWRLTAGAALMAGVLAGCGGSTSQVDVFEPGRVLVFGDELSMLTNDGHKYTINAVDDNDALQCRGNPIWVQLLAARYGMVFSECNPDAVANPKAKMLATEGATVDELDTQIRTFTSGDSIRSDDLATVLVGMNDVLQAYASYPAESEDALTARMEEAGERAASHVNDLASSGARVLISTMPDMGDTPFAKAEDLEHGDVRSRVLSRLSSAFNRSMRLKLTNDGSKLGLLLLDDLMHSMVRVPRAYGLANTDTAVCDESAPPPTCTNNTLISSDSSPTPTVTNYLWADSTRPTPVVHNALGSQAVTRATNNPF